MSSMDPAVADSQTSEEPADVKYPPYPGESDDDPIVIPKRSSSRCSKAHPDAASAPKKSDKKAGSGEGQTAKAPWFRRPPTTSGGRLAPSDPRIFSSRQGEHFMDGHIILTSMHSSYMRPWNDCIPKDQLSLENMPPFYVRLRDDQVGHLMDWLADKNANPAHPGTFNQYWPWDFSMKPDILRLRGSWGPAYVGNGGYWHVHLKGGERSPAYVDPGLPLTNTSSGKPMCFFGETGASEAVTKRKAVDELEQQGSQNGKKHCGWASEETREEIMQAFADKIETLKADHKTKVEFLEAEVVKERAEITELKTCIEDLATKVKLESEILADKSSTIQRLQEIMGQRADTIQELESANTEGRVRIGKLEEKVKELESTIKAQKLRYAALENIKHAIVEKKEKEIKELKKEPVASGLKKRLTEAEASIKTLRKTITGNQETIESNRIVFAKRNARISRLERQIEVAKSFFEQAGEALEYEKETSEREVGVGKAK